MYADAMKAMNGGGMGANPATQGVGEPPDVSGGMPPPTGVGAMPVGAPGTTLKTASADVIASLRTLQGFVPGMFNDINEWINRVKQACADKPGENPGPALGEPGPAGAAQGGASPLMQSGSSGGM